jgi:hypothetical protein
VCKWAGFVYPQGHGQVLHGPFVHLKQKHSKFKHKEHYWTLHTVTQLCSLSMAERPEA